MKKKGLTLIEVLVALTIFSAAMAAASGVFVAIQDAWRRQKMTIELIQSGRWAMEFMTNEIRLAETDGDPPAFKKIKAKGKTGLTLGRDSNNDGAEDIQVKYEYDSGTHTIRRCQRPGGGAYSAWVELVNHVADPPPGGGAKKIFEGDKDGYIEIQFILRPDPFNPEGLGNRNIVFRSSVIARND